MDVADFDYDLPRGGHRAGAGRAAGRGPAAGRPGPGGAARAPDRGRSRRACRPGRPARRQRHPGPPRPPPAAQGDRRRGRGVAAGAPAATVMGGAGPPVAPGRSWHRRHRRRTRRRDRRRPRRRPAQGHAATAASSTRTTRLARYGEVPLPPYVHEKLADPERYQTVFARRPVSVAAPTAGLHLTADVLDRCRAAGARVETIELAVGLGTFRPITTARVEDHADARRALPRAAREPWRRVRRPAG